MATSFARTLRALEADSFRGSLLALACVMALLGGWLAWFFMARIARYEVSDRARVEVDQETHPVQSPVLARVVSSDLVLGKEVKAGEVLVELDANAEQLQVAEERTQLAALQSQIDSLKAQVVQLKQARTREQQTARVAIEQAQAKYREADALARSADHEAHRLEKLAAEGLVPRRDYDVGKMEAERLRHAADGLQLEPDRIRRDLRTRESDRQAQLENLQTQIRKLEGDRTTVTASVERLSYEVERRVIRAPVSGRVGEAAATLRPGAVVNEGDRLCAILPPGRLRAIAEFAPPAAFGRIRPGQSARLRLQGFPWAQYGSIAAKVASVASEIRDGRVRVELSLAGSPTFAIPMQHGLPGTVEVEVERASPAALTLRTAGQLITRPRSSFAPNP
jgi:membrane fusion protein (multidrug efflux system)